MIHVERAHERLEDVGLAFEVSVDFGPIVDVGSEHEIGHAQLVVEKGLRAVADERAAQEREVTLVMIGKEAVQMVGDHEIEHCVAEELESLIVAERDQVERGRARAKGLRQQTDMLEFDADHVLEQLHVLQNASGRDEVTVATGQLRLQRMKR